jgi:hypothetical protein
MGSAGIAAWIAHLGFWTLLPYGWWWDELQGRSVTGFLLLWSAGWFGLPFLPYGASLLSPYVAVLDILLVFIIFKGDVHLT